MKRFWTITTVVLLSMAALMPASEKAPAAGAASPNANALPNIIFVEAPLVASGELAARFPQGSRLVRLDDATPAHSVTDLTEGFFAAADPQVSFDSSHLLFSAQKTRSARWQIWEMGADGSGKRQVTRCSGDCLRPVFLPQDQIAYTMVAGKGANRTSQVYVADTNGDGAHPITFGPGNFQVETVLQSGRILVSAESVLSASGKDGGSRVFYMLRPDGSGLSLFRSDDQPNVFRSGAEELNDGTILFVKRFGAQGDMAGGRLAWIPPGALHNSLLSPPDLGIWSARSLDGNALVVSLRKTGSSRPAGLLDLYTFDLANRSVGRRIYGDSRYSSVEAVPLEPRPIPRYYWSILHPDRDYGRIVCLDAYLSAESPQGRLTARIERVRVVARLSGTREERLLGEAPVESDGSFYIKVPADQSLRFELLDAKGHVIRAQQSWIWARSGEDVGCVGCHESKATVPRDHWPLALKRMDTPTPVGISGRVLPGQH